jgi:hypothetical protein
VAFTINQVYPWGRSLEEYRRMFNLGDEDLRRSIVGCADGPASFNAEMTACGHRVVSLDPLYQFTSQEIRGRLEATYPEVLDFTRRNCAAFVWDRISSVKELGRLRMTAMNRFLDDFEPGRRDGRYVVASLPRLPFVDHAFDLALCSHFLFLYSHQFSLEFHIHSLTEMCRIGCEARVFPLLDHGGNVSPHLEAALSSLNANGFDAAVEQVPYEFQRGGDHMLRIRRQTGCQAGWPS